MKTSFRFVSDTARLPQFTLRPKIERWVKRRAYPIAYVMTSHSVECWLEPPSNAEHNRAVRSLARICQRELDWHHDVGSRIIEKMQPV
jgi:hypothetical protein